MEGIIGALTAEVSKPLIRLLWTRIKTFLSSDANLKSLRYELRKLEKRKFCILESIDCGLREGKSLSLQAKKWLQEVAEAEQDAENILNKDLDRGASGPCATYRRSKASLIAAHKVKRLMDCCDFQVMLENRRSPIRAVETQLAASIDGQDAAMAMLRQLKEFVKDKSVQRVAVWGTGGVGKTTLVKNFNNKFEPLLTELFDVVIWVTVSKDLDLGRVQAQIAERLDLEFDPGESIHRRASRLHRRLMLRRKSLIIFDDVWQKIDLDIMGIPHGDGQGKCNIIITTRVFDVCREMMTDKDIKLDLLDDEAAWKLFVQVAGKEAEREGIEPLGRAICQKCCGLPLAIKTVATSMRSRKMIETWRDTLHRLNFQSPSSWMLEKEVFVPLKVSYSSLPSNILRDCFLYCCMYPPNTSIEVDELVQCWVSDGLIDKRQSLNECLDNGIALIERLKDSCMLEQGDRPGTVKMHNVWRDLALYICATEPESGFYYHSATVPSETSKNPGMLPARSLKRVSLVSTGVASLPARFWGNQELTVLLLQENPIRKIPETLFSEHRMLRYVNLSNCCMNSLPPSLLLLKELRSLLLQDCRSLESLPLLGVLWSLEFLDLSGTRLRELPKDTGKLIRLRTLNLSRTYHLEHIESGTLSGMSSLESLDMSFSSYKWDEKSNFDELLSLERLSNLQLRIDTLECLPEGTDGLMARLQKFGIWVGPGNCEPGCSPVRKPGEKRAILKGIDLMVLTRGLEILLRNCTNLDVVSCGGISDLSGIATWTGLNGLANIKFINITGCSGMKNVLCCEKVPRAVLTNLEHLGLYHMDGLVKILGGMVPRGTFRKLKTIEVSNCHKLKKLANFALLSRIRNIEEVRIANCDEVRAVFSGTDSARVLPELKVMEMRDMRSLRDIRHSRLSFPGMSRLEVSNCPELRKLPFSYCELFTIREIRGDFEWWQRLVWPDEYTKTRLQERYQVIITSPPRNEDPQG